jgi:NAD(P)-dependent dehydrogenase (short-subunit alcohol dehydrogenase family)
MKTAFITGAAQGIGLAIARQFAREGYQVGLFDVNAARCEELLSHPEFKHAVAGFCDVRDSASINEALSTFTQATGGQLHVLVNNAGVLSGGEIMTHSESQIRAMVDVNVTGLTMVSCAAHPLLKATGGCHGD